jgi:hypothetical protein
MSIAQVKHAFWSIWNRQEGTCSHSHESFGSKVRRAYREGKLDEQIRKAEIDYTEGRALDRLY